MSVHLRELLKLKELGCFTLEAGSKGINSNVTWTNSIESPDLVKFVHPSELVLTTGIEIKNDNDALIKLVLGAFEAGAAGIVINLGPYIQNLPESVLDFAKQKQLCHSYFSMGNASCRYHADHLRIYC